MHDSMAADFNFSRGQRETTDLETLKAHIPGCVSVEKTGEALDRLHIDYVAYLRRGAVLHIDGKTRRKGAAKYWKAFRPGRKGVADGEPDLAIEVWSVTPQEEQVGRVGWTLDESSDTDLILYTFDSADTNEFFLLSFPLLRIAARQCYKSWLARFRDYPQYSRSSTGKVLWQSQCCFVPAQIVQDAIRSVERGRMPQAKKVVPEAPFGRVTEEQLREIGRACFGIKYPGDSPGR
jgi:hypothetical protein